MVTHPFNLAHAEGKCMLHFLFLVREQLRKQELPIGKS